MQEIKKDDSFSHRHTAGKVNGTDFPKWEYGDVFAYQLESDLAKEKGLYGRYLLIQKVDEYLWNSKDIVPIVYVKITDTAALPSNCDEFNQTEYIQTWFTRYEERFFPIDMSRPEEDVFEKSKINYQVDEYGFLPQYRIKLLDVSKGIVPAKLIYLGKFLDIIYPQNEFVPHSKENITRTSWGQLGEEFETKMIVRYCGHNLRELGIYRRQGDGSVVS